MARLGSASGSKANNAAWFSPAVEPPGGDDQPVILHFSLASNATLEATYDNGSSWHKVDGGDIFLAGVDYHRKFFLDSDSQFNIRQTSGGAVTVNFAKVHSG